MRFTFETKIFIGLFLTVALTVSFIVYAVQEPGREDRAEEKFTRESMERGARIFVGATISEVNCMLCHGLRGQGTLGQAQDPALIGRPLNPEFRALADPSLGELDRNVAIETIAFGRAGTGMQEWGSKLSDDKLRDVATFVANWDQEILDEALAEKTAVSVFQSLNQVAPEGTTADLASKAEDFEERLAEALLEHDAPVLTVEDEAALVETLVNILRQQGPKNIDKLVAGALEEVLGPIVVKPPPTPTQPVEETPTAAAAEETPVAEPTQVETVLPGDPEAGRELFITLGCTVCHTISSIPEAIGLLGPNQDRLATTAANRVEGLSAEEYIRQSILDPSAFIVEGFFDLMPSNFGDLLSEEELNDLVAFLLTLE